MRALIAVLFIAGFAGIASAQDLPPMSASGPSPFPVERGTAPPPPAASAAVGRAPPEGEAAGGLDFGQWREAQPGAYTQRFQALVAQRYGGGRAPEVRADLEANGFACEDAQRLDCRIEIVEAGCAFDWYVVLERAQAAPIAGFDRVCRRQG